MSRKCDGDGHYTIYHIKGEKIGCTKNVEARKRDYRHQRGECPPMYLIERIPLSKGERFAGDREHYWADHFGYLRGSHYADTMATIRNRKYPNGRGANALKKLTTAQRKALSKKLIAEGIAGFTAAGDVTCPHCDIVGNTAIMQAWHFDRCLDNPKLTDADRAARSGMSVAKVARCPHCKKEGQLVATKRWHFGNCKHRKKRKK